MLGATLRAGEHGSCHSMHTGWVARHLPDPEVRGYLDDAIPGPASITGLRGSLGRALQHTLLQSQPGKRWPYLEHWDLDWATADPVGYLQRHAPRWLCQQLILGDLEPVQTRLRPRP